MSDEKIAELKAATREANETLKDLRQAIKQARSVIEDISMEAEREVEEMVNPVIAKTLRDYSGTITKAIEDATEAVYRRFDTIGDMLMGEDRSTRKKGDPSLIEMVEARLGGGTNGEQPAPRA